MKRAILVFACFALTLPCIAQNPDDPASSDDVILYLRTMHSHDMMQKMMQVQVQSMQQLFRDMTVKEKGNVPADFDTNFKKKTDDLIKNMPMDEMVQAMIPAYQKHFTHGDIEAMNAFYSSPVGQKVLEELPAVTGEAMQSMMPILTKYLSDWKERMKKDLEDSPGKGPAKD
jgi:uncharacterized protein